MTSDALADMPESDNWKLLLSPYAECPQRALDLAQQLYVLKEQIKAGKKDRQRAVAELEKAIETLFEYSDFRSISRELFEQRIAGSLKPKQERILRELGVKF